MPPEMVCSTGASCSCTAVIFFIISDGSGAPGRCGLIATISEEKSRSCRWSSIPTALGSGHRAVDGELLPDGEVGVPGAEAVDALQVGDLEPELLADALEVVALLDDVGEPHAAVFGLDEIEELVGAGGHHAHDRRIDQ